MLPAPMVYGLTKGQASPTSARGFHTPIQVDGVLLEPFNPLAVAIALDASFVARTCTVDPPALKTVLKRAIEDPGYALVDALHPCVSFNKVNTFEWFREASSSISTADRSRCVTGKGSSRSNRAQLTTSSACREIA